jgi:RNA-directed DNA polymerase
VREPLNTKLRQVKATLRGMMHMPIPEQGRYLRLVLNGFYNYYAVPTNFRALNAFYYHVLWHWLRCLRRRSQRHRLTWRKMMRYRGASAPLSRLAVRRHDPRWEPGALAAHAGICAGAASNPVPTATGQIQ